MVCGDLIKFDFSSIVFFCILNFVILLLDSVEALNLMVSHCKLLACDWWNVLNEADHCFITLRIKFFVISRLNLTKSANSFLLSGCKWVLWKFWLKIISKVSYKSHSIFKFYVKSLVVYWCPFTWDYFFLTLLIIWTEDCLSFIIFHYIDSVNIFGSKLEKMLFID